MSHFHWHRGLPVIELSAIPDNINAGETVTLTWGTTHADSVSIEPGIGSVDLNGMLVVMPMQTTTYTLTATGSGGTRSAGVTVTVYNPISLQITSPLEGTTLSDPNTVVRGTVTNTENNETGVTVNGVPAMGHDNQFTANVLLAEGENTITATATDTAGNSVSASITVTLQSLDQYIKISADPTSGVDPLETTLSIRGSFDFTASSVSYIGPGEVEFLETGADQYRVRMNTPGIYYFTAEVDDQGNVHTATISIVVFDQTQLDQLLREKWEGHKAALMDQDIEKALTYFAEDQRVHYNTLFTGFSDHLPQIIEKLQNLELVKFEGNMAKYYISKDEIWNGQTYTLPYEVIFVVDRDGIWRIYWY